MHRWFLLGCLAEIFLFGVALALGWLFKQPLLATLRWRADDAVLGIAGAFPLLVLFWWMLRSRLRPLAEIRDFLEAVVRPIFGQWPVPQLAVIQGGLTSAVGLEAALVLASVLFGVCHFVNWAYAITATLIGLYLGALWLFTGNVLAPAVTHAVYDFAALVYFLRICRPQGTV